MCDTTLSRSLVLPTTCTRQPYAPLRLFPHPLSLFFMAPKSAGKEPNPTKRKPAVAKSALVPAVPKPTTTGKASTNSQKLSVSAAKQLAAAKLYDREPVPLIEQPTPRVSEAADNADNAEGTSRSRKRVDYCKLNGKGAARRSSAQVAAAQNEKKKALAAGVALRQAKIDDFAEYEDEVESRIAEERKQAANPPVPSRVKVKRPAFRAPVNESESGDDFSVQVCIFIH
ncbi:hypothetical protein OF83DRAFT_1189267, partial [Amylostereum chailletii]